MGFDLASYLERCRDQVEACLDRFLPAAETAPGKLYGAMRYSLFAGGKRIRPAFSLAACEAVGGDVDGAVPFAAAVEMIHSYSLIHDDLPAMDDDDLRRGKPTNHRVYGEGVAILAGDGLLTDAFQLLAETADAGTHPPHTVVAAVRELARAAGSRGMVAGQALDLGSEGRELDLPTLEFLHVHKTGALIRAATVLGGLAGGAAGQVLEDLTRYGERIGLAFQIADDVLDEEGTVAELGKPVGSDRGRAKATYPALLGLSESKRLARLHMDAAVQVLAPLGQPAEPLRALARFVVERRH